MLQLGRQNVGLQPKCTVIVVHQYSKTYGNIGGDILVAKCPCPTAALEVILDLTFLHIVVGGVVHKALYRMTHARELRYLWRGSSSFSSYKTTKWLENTASKRTLSQS